MAKENTGRHAFMVAAGILISRIVGLIVSDITNPFFPELVKGFEEAATEKGYEVLLSNTGYDSLRMANGVRSMLERKVDAVAIMTGAMKPPPML